MDVIRQLNSEKRIVTWLNRKGGDKSTRERMGQLVRDVRALAGAQPIHFQIPSREGHDLLRRIGMHGKTPMTDAMGELRRRNTGLQEMEGPRQFDSKAAARVDLILKQFTYRPYVNLLKSIPTEKTGKLILQMIPLEWNPPVATVAEVDRGVWPTTRMIDGAPSNVQEALIVQFLILAARSGNIDRIRECNCGGWFLAQRRDRRYCGEACRKKYHEPSDEQKQKRRVWRREYQKRYWKLNPSKRSNRKTSGVAKAPTKKGGK